MKAKRKFIVSAHQPVLFPNNAFFGKMRDSEIFELAIYDKYTNGKNLFSARMNIGTEEKYKGYKLPLEKFSFGVDRICDIKLKDGYQFHLWEGISGAYSQFPNWRNISSMVKSMIFDVKFSYLWEFDFHILMRLKEFYGINTPVAISEQPPINGKTEDLIWLIEKYNGTGYVSGMGGKMYIDQESFKEKGYELLWYDRDNDRCSVLTRLFNGNYKLYDNEWEQHEKG